MTPLLAMLLAADPAAASVSCGASCVFLLAREAGRPVSLEAAAAALTDSAEGHSFADLRRAAANLGVKAAVSNVKGSGKLPRGPFVAHFQSAGGGAVGHFVFFRPLEPTFTQYQLVAPPLEPEVLEARDLLARRDFTGWVMAPADRTPRLLAGGALLGAAALLFGLGSVRRLFRVPGRQRRVAESAAV